MIDLLPCNRSRARFGGVCNGTPEIRSLPGEDSWNAVCMSCGTSVDGAATPEQAAEDWNIVQRIPDHEGQTDD